MRAGRGLGDEPDALEAGALGERDGVPEACVRDERVRVDGSISCFPRPRSKGRGESRLVSRKREERIAEARPAGVGGIDGQPDHHRAGRGAGRRRRAGREEKDRKTEDRAEVHVHPLAPGDADCKPGRQEPDRRVHTVIPQELACASQERLQCRSNQKDKFTFLVRRDPVG